MEMVEEEKVVKVAEFFVGIVQKSILHINVLSCKVQLKMIVNLEASAYVALTSPIYPTHIVNRILCKCAPPIKQNQASSNVKHSAFDTEWITLVGRDGQEVSVLCTYDSFTSQSSISGKMATDLQLLQEDLGQITIQA